MNDLVNARSICTCGHIGDGAIGGEHAGMFGHGACRAKDCKCVKFTWKAFIEGPARKQDESYISVSSSATSFVGPDAVNLMRAISLVSALKLYAKHKMMVTRGLTPTRLLEQASGYSGKAYKRGQYWQAAADVQVWADAMKAALPVEHK